MFKFKFINDTTEFNLQNAHNLAMLADLAYQNDKEIKKVILEDLKAQHYRFFNSSDGTQGFVMSDENIIVVSFRGTEPNKIKDWITDLNFNLVDGPFEAKVHEGFYTALSNVWQKIERTIAEFRANKPKSLWFTGHSLGAALAALAVARLRDDDRPVDGLYTFGQPRIGDRKFARNFNFDFKPYAFRFVNNNDIVTRVPPRALKYSHIGNFKYFTAEGQLVEDISWWNRFIDRMHGRIDDILEWGTDGIKDHDMTAYLKFIEDALSK